VVAMTITAAASATTVASANLRARPWNYRKSGEAV
jgi:hypothetical protein